MIEYCNIFSSFNLCSFHAISGAAIFYKSHLSSFKIFRIAFHVKVKIKIVCFERLIKSFDSAFGGVMRDKILSIDHYMTEH